MFSNGVKSVIFTYSMNKKLTFIDLFAGLGGIRLGFESAGATCVFSSEWDKAAQDTYEANFGERPHGDITQIATSEIPDHDILTGGFPCQTFSIIGHGKGFADTRGTMFFEIERILRDKKPEAFLLENVKQLVTHDKGKTFKVILDTLHELGYYVHFKVLNGLNFGVPQKRERILIVGFRHNYPFTFPDKPLREPLKLSDILEPDEKVEKKHFLSDSYREKIQGKAKLKDIYPAVWHENKAGNLGIHEYSCALRANASYSYLTVNGVRRLTPREMFRLQGFPDSYKIIGGDGHARKQAGNSVVVPKMEAVAHAMVKAMNQQPIPEPIKQVTYEQKEQVKILMPSYATQ